MDAIYPVNAQLIWWALPTPSQPKPNAVNTLNAAYASFAA